MFGYRRFRDSGDKPSAQKTIGVSATMSYVFSSSGPLPYLRVALRATFELSVIRPVIGTWKTRDASTIGWTKGRKQPTPAVDGLVSSEAGREFPGPGSFPGGFFC
jgi:hypothetical protein